MSEQDQDRVQDPLAGMEPEAAPLEPGGDPPPEPTRPRRGRKPKAAGSGSAPPVTTEREERGPAVRASKAAVAGAQAAYGLMGTAGTFIGQVSETPGLVAAGFVMQAQAEAGGKVIAKKAVGTGFYPYLEKMGTAGDLAPLILAPVAAAMFVEVPAIRVLIGPVAMQLLDGVETEMLQQDGSKAMVSVWDVIQSTAAEVDKIRAGAVAASPNGQAPPGGGENPYAGLDLDGEAPAGAPPDAFPMGEFS